jgi:hypothetical protein
MRIFGREPAIWLGVIAAALNLAVGFGLPVTTVQTGLINAAVAGVLAVVAAVAVRPFPVPLLIGAVNAALALGIGFGAPISSGVVGMLDALIVAVAAVVLRSQVSPLTPPVAPDKDGTYRPFRA